LFLFFFKNLEDSNVAIQNEVRSALHDIETISYTKNAHSQVGCSVVTATSRVVVVVSSAAAVEIGFICIRDLF
jgi:hypothetical protein